MLHPFISAASAGKFHPMVATVSAALHAAILYLAVAPTRSPVLTEPARASIEHVELAVLSFGTVPLRVARALVSTQEGGERLRHSLPSAVVRDFQYDLPRVTSPTRDAGDNGGANEFSAVVLQEFREPPKDIVFPNLTYEVAEVEIEAIPAPANPKPEYPLSMVRRQVEARFAVYFVVDTSGRVDTESVELPLVPHEAFTTAVLAVLEKWHFAPAEIGGRRVRERVKQPFYFKLR